MSEQVQWPLDGEFETLGDALAGAASQFGGVDAYVDGARRLTFAEWLRAADASAAVMAALGVRSGDVVAVYVPSSIEYAVACAAGLRLGAVVTGLNTRLGPREIDAICSRATPALIVHDPSLGAEGLPLDVPILESSRLTEIIELRVTADPPAHERSRSDAAVIIWTSGTTGQPKGAWFDHANLLAIARAAGVISAPFDRKLSATPFAHAGYMGKLWDQIAWGSTTVICPTPWRADEMATLLRTESISVAGGAPTQWEKLLDVLEASSEPTPELRIGIVATAPAPPPLIERVQRTLGCTLVVRYAMTESPSISGTEPDDSEHVKARTVGRAQRGMELGVLDPAGGASPVGTPGDVEVRGDCVMRGYWRDDELSGATISPDGWLHTNDTGYLDGGGNLVLVGRTSEMYIRGGYNIYPLEVENVLLEHPKVAEAAIVGAPAPVIGEVGVAFIAPTDRSDPPTSEELSAWVSTQLADYKAPDEYRLLDALPRTKMLKIDKEPLRRELDEHPPTRR